MRADMVKRKPQNGHRQPRLWAVLLLMMCLLVECGAQARACPINFGTATFTTNGAFVPPEGTNAACPLLVHALIIGGGGKGGDGQLAQEPCSAGGGGGSGQVVAVQMMIAGPAIILAGGPGKTSRFGIYIASGGADGQSAAKGGQGGAAQSANYGGDRGMSGETNGTRDKAGQLIWPRQTLLQFGRYAPQGVQGVTFQSVDILEGQGGSAGNTTDSHCGAGGGGGGFLLNHVGPRAQDGQSDISTTLPHDVNGKGGQGYGAGGGGAVAGPGGRGAPGVVFVEW
jgi:hypothetical protein